MIDPDKILTITGNRYLSFYDLQYEDGKHYYEVSRNQFNDLVAGFDDQKFIHSFPDAVTICLIIKSKGEEERLFLSKEYRYPVGRFLLCPPAGLIDDKETSEGPFSPVILAAKREVEEETGIVITENDSIFIVNDKLFSSPGMTDESNALVCAVVNIDYPEKYINQDKAEGTELFNGYILLNKIEAEKILKTGKDENGFSYSVYTWAVLMYFVYGQWRETK